MEKQIHMLNMMNSELKEDAERLRNDSEKDKITVECLKLENH